MASLTITVPDSAVLRIRLAFGTWNGLTRVPATQQEMLDRMKTFLATTVLNYEADQAAQASKLANDIGTW